MGTRRTKAEETRQRLYECALDVFRREGVAACRIEDIARAAGVSRGTFYFHFATKEQVLLARMRETEEHACEAIDALPPDASLESVIECLNETLAAIWEPDPELLPEVTSAAMHYTATTLNDQEATPLRSALSARFRAAVERGEAQGLLPPDILSDLYLGHTLAALLAWYGNRRLSLRTMLSAVTRLFWEGARGR